MTIIGLVGEKGSGKETFTKFFCEAMTDHSVAVICFSDLLAETLTLWGMPVTRKNLQQLAGIMNTGFGEGTLTHAIRERIKLQSSDMVLLDGVRWESDWRMIRELPNSMLIYLTAKPKIRYERLKLRNQKVGESEATIEQFLEEEKAYTEIFIAKIGADADHTIENNGTLAEYRERVRVFIQAFFPR